ncbi:hypothetical protein [Pantoea sp. V106_11]|uniref:hypothetical protein n=1 Tax=Pantoea sp. V106_11 TaxID=3044234 RepID=UPI00249E900F|nr:hypothetical protein [Pantoea sp. V106_11]MDI3416063.1 hypothetical protein [Pantoea sp. V106_11]
MNVMLKRRWPRGKGINLCGLVAMLLTDNLVMAWLIKTGQVDVVSWPVWRMMVLASLVTLGVQVRRGKHTLLTTVQALTGLWALSLIVCIVNSVIIWAWPSSAFLYCALCVSACMGDVVAPAITLFELTFDRV